MKSFKLLIPVHSDRRRPERPITLPGIPGPPGAPGQNAITYTAETDSNTRTGNTMYIKNNGRLGLAIANSIGTSKVCGLARSFKSAGQSLQYEPDGILEQSDWTGIIGTTSLSPGQTYFLSPDSPGQLTALAPITSGQLVVKVGFALTSTRLEIEIEEPILL